MARIGLARIGLAGLLVLVSGICGASEFNSGSMPLSAGWDDATLPLHSSNVAWFARPIGGGRLSLGVVFNLSGSIPNHRFAVGVHFFETETSRTAEIESFGGKRMGGRDTITRDGRTHTLLGGYDFGVLQTDDQGNGSAEFAYEVPDVPYAAQFTVRNGTNCPAQASDCNCVYRTGKEFGLELERFGSSRGSSPSGPAVEGEWFFPCLPTVDVVHQNDRVETYTNVRYIHFEHSRDHGTTMILNAPPGERRFDLSDIRDLDFNCEEDCKVKKGD